ncbi:MAG: hypothetical protein HKL99_14165 [Burkholderiales bacterium]|nr:hypothetical protein [Burkholderiales bacterium]
MKISLRGAAVGRLLGSLALIAAVSPGAWGAAGKPISPASSASAAAAANAAAATPPLPDVLMGSTAAFDAAEANELPLSPQQIQALRDRAVATAQAIHAGLPPSLSSPSIPVSFAPGAPVPSVRIAPGFITNIQFVGVDGAPWPIVAATVANPQWFSVVQPADKHKDAPPNVLTANALTMSASSSMSVLLKGAPSAISVVLMTDTKEGFATATLRMDQRSPDAQPQAMVAPQIGQATPAMLSFLDGIAPQGAAVLAAAGGSGTEVQAWSYAQHIFVRTRDDLLSPAWERTSSAPDGTHVYELVNASVLDVMVGGQVQQVVLQPGTATAAGQ